MPSKNARLSLFSTKQFIPMLYENQQIGAFTTLISYYLGYHRYQLPFSINTYQQTPKNDAIVGDVLSHIRGKYFIFEFKRSKKEFKSETKKGKAAELGKLLASASLKELSSKGHFIAHGESIIFEQNQKTYRKLDFVFYPYWSIIPELGNSSTNIPEINGVEVLLRKMMSTEQLIGLSETEFKIYLRLLKDVAGDETYSTSGTVFCVNSETGEMMNIEFDNYLELDRTFKLQWDQFQSIRLEQELGQRRANKKAFQRGGGMGKGGF